LNGDDPVEVTKAEDEEGIGEDVEKPVVVALIGVTAGLFKLMVVAGA